ncbi:chorismate synthase [Tepidanaerobacter syntrophicus]|uniref:Chorismate synthase n=1 Tax=Tepidanaerobacter syntrophicus TaxID=224999 RepID=A0A0U9HGB4_9FIRM|nr:chorismate synthase [Tepidanaerobacter syntrophicus]GAQ25722.1 chorismate synthase [Tepidanaerobacter syntrophicus]GLI20092.1 chorismate synthase [Tepidanaerobacter syntrophicus]
MSSSFGHKFKITIFGESHGKAIGVVLDGLPPGIKLDMEFIKSEMARRSPGKSSLSTARSEADEVEILSGYFNGMTTGAPLCGIIFNRNVRSEDYSAIRNLMRPSHADYTAFIKYDGFYDYRGGGHFSGRITAPLVFAGAIAKQILSTQNIAVGSHIKSIHNIEDKSFDYVNLKAETLESLRYLALPVLDKDAGEKMEKCILNAKEEKDSVGGVIEAAVVNLEAGLGSPFFDSVESRLAHILFSIPAVKGVEFGAGFDITKMRGFKANDEFVIENGKIRTSTNNSGGIAGGITNGMPIIFRVAVKPTPSISLPQKTVDISKFEESSICIKGRHDPCIVPRAVPVVEAAASVVILDFLLERYGEKWIQWKN